MSAGTQVMWGAWPILVPESAEATGTGIHRKQFFVA